MSFQPTYSTEFAMKTKLFLQGISGNVSQKTNYCAMTLTWPETLFT